MLAPLRISLVLLVICGGIYPVLVTLVGGTLFPYQAQGSIITRSDGTPVGSELIAQAFDKDIYFHPRPSAAGADGYDATASAGSNLGPTNQKLIDRVTSDASALQQENPNLTVLPADLLTTSGSGLDPDISPEAAHGPGAARRPGARHLATAGDATWSTATSRRLIWVSLASHGSTCSS